MIGIGAGSFGSLYPLMTAWVIAIGIHLMNKTCMIGSSVLATTRWSLDTTQGVFWVGSRHLRLAQLTSKWLQVKLKSRFDAQDLKSGSYFHGAIAINQYGIVNVPQQQKNLFSGGVGGCAHMHECVSKRQAQILTHVIAFPFSVSLKHRRERQVIGDINKIIYTCVSFHNFYCLSSQNKQLVWIETPSNPTLKVVDIQGCADIVHKHKGVILAVDNTFMSAYFQVS